MMRLATPVLEISNDSKQCAFGAVLRADGEEKYALPKRLPGTTALKSHVSVRAKRDARPHVAYIVIRCSTDWWSREKLCGRHWNWLPVTKPSGIPDIQPQSCARLYGFTFQNSRWERIWSIVIMDLSDSHLVDYANYGATTGESRMISLMTERWK